MVSPCHLCAGEPLSIPFSWEAQGAFGACSEAELNPQDAAALLWSERERHCSSWATWDGHTRLTWSHNVYWSPGDPKAPRSTDPGCAHTEQSLPGHTPGRRFGVSHNLFLRCVFTQQIFVEPHHRLRIQGFDKVPEMIQTSTIQLYGACKIVRVEGHRQAKSGEMEKMLHGHGKHTGTGETPRWKGEMGYNA